MKFIIKFLGEGFNVLFESSKGEYSIHSEYVDTLLSDVLSRRYARKSDKYYLLKDRSNISSDARKAFNKLVQKHG